MLLQTKIQIPHFENQINYNQEILTIGSCFSAVIGQKLLERKFKTLNNPFGTIFNPLSIIKLLQYSLNGKFFSEDLITQHQGRYLHYDFHSDISGNSPSDLMEKIKVSTERTAKILKEASALIITFGTAHVYEYIKSSTTVANCHKQAGQLFNKRLLSISEILHDFDLFHNKLIQINPNIQIILTVSPVRHIKDGIAENQLSKSLLRLLCHEISSQYAQANYFPSYEIMMDELRDYRFYKEDMIHPTAQAEDYIWERFSQSFFSEDTRNKILLIENIIKSLSHKAFNPKGGAHQKFLSNLLLKMEQLEPEFDFSDEINQVKAKFNPTN
ncbi:GSCFA domain-containing protein [Echinicola shivajiensis]|uniref:GSCFA domain-containing protein n=1 Tax=Echinicola shivajiensis TaxID=1035916 RepID=UPI001BFC8DB7|nr:GSCFA domain-containing protein [Echinicola shivajiensis]